MKFVNFLIKPASSLCNLRCKYCFYWDEAENRSQKSMGMMTQSTVDALLTQAFSAVEPGGGVSFAFQGGEPTLAGLDFFRGFVEKARLGCPDQVELTFALQTNGILLDGQWADFLKREGFLVGLSVDGFKELHDLHRVDPAGGGSWGKSMKGLALLRQRNVDVNALCVVTLRCARSPEKVYRSLRKLGFRYIQFIACLDPLGQIRGRMPYSLTPEAYGKFLCGVFDAWYADWERGDYCSVGLFEDYVRILLGDGAGTCATRGNCGAYFVVEGDGSVYPCDFFALDPWKMGVLGENTLEEMMESENARRFLRWGAEKPGECAVCRYRGLCNGGCKNDWYGGGNYFCKSFQTLLDYAYPRLAMVAREEYLQRVSALGSAKTRCPAKDDLL